MHGAGRCSRRCAAPASKKARKSSRCQGLEVRKGWLQARNYGSHAAGASIVPWHSFSCRASEETYGLFGIYRQGREGCQSALRASKVAQALQEPVSDEFGLPQANENLFSLRFSPKAAAWALAKSAPAKRAFREALTKGTLRPRTLKARRYWKYTKN